MLHSQYTVIYSTSSRWTVILHFIHVGWPLKSTEWLQWLLMFHSCSITPVKKFTCAKLALYKELDKYLSILPSLPWCSTSHILLLVYLVTSVEKSREGCVCIHTYLFFPVIAFTLHGIGKLCNVHFDLDTFQYALTQLTSMPAVLQTMHMHRCRLTQQQVLWRQTRSRPMQWKHTIQLRSSMKSESQDLWSKNGWSQQWNLL